MWMNYKKRMDKEEELPEIEMKSMDETNEEKRRNNSSSFRSPIYNDVTPPLSPISFSPPLSPFSQAIQANVLAERVMHYVIENSLRLYESIRREEEKKNEYRRPTCLPIALLNEVQEEDEDEEKEEEEEEDDEDGPQESKKMKKEVLSDEDWEMI